MKDIELIADLCPKQSEKCDYWLVRTEGGYLYEPFLENNVIAIGYPEISRLEFDQVMGKQDARTEYTEFKNMVEKKYPENKRPGLIASQLYKFGKTIKKDDYVMVPNYCSQKFCIGQIDSDIIDEKLMFYKDNALDDYRKIRKVRWIKEVKRSEVNPNLFGLFSSHQFINNAKAYEDYIDSLLFDFYEKYGVYHLLLDVQTKKDIKAKDLFKTLFEILGMTDEICINYKVDENTDQITTKINLNSPGKVELIGKVVKPLFFAGAIVVALNGGSFKLKVPGFNDLDTELKTSGIINNINEYMNSQQDRELKSTLKQKIDSLNIRDPEKIVDILKEINRVNQND